MRGFVRPSILLIFSRGKGHFNGVLGSKILGNWFYDAEEMVTAGELLALRMVS